MTSKIALIVLLLNTLPLVSTQRGQSQPEALFDQFLKLLLITGESPFEGLFNPEKVPLPIMYSLFKEIMHYSNPPKQGKPKKMPAFDAIKQKLQAIWLKNKLQSSRNMKKLNGKQNGRTFSSRPRSNLKRFRNKGRLSNSGRRRGSTNYPDNVTTGTIRSSRIKIPTSFKFNHKTKNKYTKTIRRPNKLSKRPGKTSWHFNKRTKTKNTDGFLQFKNRMKNVMPLLKFAKPASTFQGSGKISQTSARNRLTRKKQATLKRSDTISKSSKNNSKIKKSNLYNSQTMKKPMASTFFQNLMGWKFEQHTSKPSTPAPSNIPKRKVKVQATSNAEVKQSNKNHGRKSFGSNHGSKSSGSNQKSNHRSVGFGSYLLKMAQRMSQKSQSGRSNTKSTQTGTGPSKIINNNQQAVASDRNTPQARTNSKPPNIVQTNAQTVVKTNDKPKRLAALSLLSTLWQSKPSSVQSNNHPAKSLNFQAVKNISPNGQNQNGNFGTSNNNQVQTINTQTANTNIGQQHTNNMDNRFNKRASNVQMHQNMGVNTNGMAKAFQNQQNIAQNIKVIPTKIKHINNKILENMQSQIAKQNIIKQASKSADTSGYIGPDIGAASYHSSQTIGPTVNIGPAVTSGMQDYNGGTNFNSYSQPFASGYTSNTPNVVSVTQSYSAVLPSVNTQASGHSATMSGVNTQPTGQSATMIQTHAQQSAFMHHMPSYQYEKIEYFVRDTIGGVVKESTEMLFPTLEHIRNEAYNVELYIDTTGNMGQGLFLLYRDACWIGSNSDHAQFIKAITNVTRNAQMGSMVNKSPTVFSVVAEPVMSNVIPRLSPAIFEQKQCDGKPVYYLSASNGGSGIRQQCFNFAAADLCTSLSGSTARLMAQPLPPIF